jgi:hypothetical protein
MLTLRPIDRLAKRTLQIGLLTPLGAAMIIFPASGNHVRQETHSASAPPPNAKGVIVLFSGKQEDVAGNWLARNLMNPAGWKVADGAMIARGGDIISKERFTDYQLHIEFRVPYMPDAKGQARGNSGVFMQGRYEIQVLDSFGIADPGTGDCGAVYNQSAPLVNACKPPKEWQAYDIVFRAPRFDDAGTLIEKARVTVRQNGTVVQNNTEIKGPTWGDTFGKLSEPGPIVLQDHGNPVEYRNIWILPLPLKAAAHY